MAEIAGLKLIVPSSVAGSGVSVSASGKVSFTSATSVSVNGCFDSTYDNYLIVCTGILASGVSSFTSRMRLSGTDATGSDYTYQRLNADNTSVGGSRLTGTSWFSGNLADAARSGIHMYVYGPALAQATAMRVVNVGGYNSAYIYDSAGTHSLSTAYDGITIYPFASNMTGSLTIYGLSQ